DQVGSVVGRPGPGFFVAPQTGDDIGDGIPRIALVDPITLCYKLTRWRLDGMGGQRLLDPVGDDGLAECVEFVVRNKVVSESQCDGIGTGERRTGECGMQTQ